jgi:hypothetical protein
MRQRLAVLRRLTSLYEGIEESHSMALQRTMAAVREAEQAMDVQQAAVRSSDFDGREALISGDRMSWNAAKTQREIAKWRRERLEQVRLEREMLEDEAKRQYIASHVQSEQMKHLVDQAATQVEIDCGRRMQAALDERFLARKRWIDTRKKLRAIAEMNAS